MNKSLSTGLFVAVLLAMTSCIHKQEKGYVEIDYFRLVGTGPIPSGNEPKLEAILFV
jgi:hypothetical protein